MTKSSLFKKILIVEGVVILFFGVVYYIGFIEMKNVGGRIGKLTSTLNEESDTEAHLDATRKTVEMYAADIASVSSSYVKSDGDVEFIENIEALARKYGLIVRIDSLNFSEPNTLAGSGMLAFDIKAHTEGEWNGTYAFLHELESLPVKVMTTSVTLASPFDDNTVAIRGGAEKAKWQSTIAIRVLKKK